MNSEKPPVLRNLLTKDQWGKLLEPLKSTLGAAPCAFDSENVRLNETCIISPVCALLLNTEEGTRRCERSQERLSSRVESERAVVVSRCHARFMKSLGPVMIGDEMVGTVGACSILPFDEDIDEDFYRGLAEEVGLKPDIMVAAAEGSQAIRTADMQEQLGRIVHLVNEAVNHLLPDRSR